MNPEESVNPSVVRQIQAALQEVMMDPTRLGLTWDLRPATVQQSAPNVSVIIDGDSTPVTAYTMIGSVTTFQRVYVIIVPPGGNFIVGTVGVPPAAHANIWTAGIVASSSSPSNLEAAIPSGTYASEPTFDFAGGKIYRVFLTTGVVGSSDANTIVVVRVRKGSATTSGTQLCFWQFNYFSGCTQCATGYIKNIERATVSTKLSVTITRALGPTTTSLYGDGNIIGTLSIQDLGLAVDNPDLALVAGSV